MPGERVILTLFAQLALILALTRLMGWIFSRFHQPQMLGEMIGGLILGPSLEDTDFNAAITRFQTLQTALQANLQTTSRLLDLTLLDFLR